MKSRRDFGRPPGGSAPDDLESGAGSGPVEEVDEGEVGDEPERYTFSVHGGEEEVRLDRFLVERLSGAHSREYLKELIQDGFVLVDGDACKPGRTLKEGQVVDVTVPPPEAIECLAENLPLTVRYEDEHLLVVEKPRGMLTHPLGRFQSGTLVNALLYHCRDLSGIGGAMRPGIVHRLDRVTSGLLVVAKHDRAQRGLQDLFRTRAIEKRYLALVEGVPESRRGLVDAPLGRNPYDRNAFRVDLERGRPSQTSYVRRKTFGRITLMELYLHTGRTHQIRVHMRFIGHPVVGDTLYGARPAPAIRDAGVALHAWTLGFTHPVTGAAIRCQAPLPQDLRDVIRGAREPGA